MSTAPRGTYIHNMCTHTFPIINVLPVYIHVHMYNTRTHTVIRHLTFHCSHIHSLIRYDTVSHTISGCDVDSVCIGRYHKEEQVRQCGVLNKTFNIVADRERVTSDGSVVISQGTVVPCI